MKILFNTTRLTIRQLSLDDFDDMYAICGDAELMQYMDDGQPLTPERTRQWVEKSIQNYAAVGFGCSAVMAKSDHAFMGFCGLVYQSENVEIIYAYKKVYWGQGFASEAALAMLEYGFTVCKLPEIWATVDPQNVPSIRIIEKMGMSFQYEAPDEHNLPTRFYVIRNPVSHAAF